MLEEEYRKIGNQLVAIGEAILQDSGGLPEFVKDVVQAKDVVTPEQVLTFANNMRILARRFGEIGQWMKDNPAKLEGRRAQYCRMYASLYLDPVDQAYLGAYCLEKIREESNPRQSGPVTIPLLGESEAEALRAEISALIENEKQRP